ncbi:hypothetical protein J7F03_06995 [Streptomyces sp. ISL-43]|uniref:hypothetical protein n=1 Tax=Streptomyces sp. ISL-43 TaxID=2819183 RepID=UPI001BE8540B|nr:hypothetical protein [Streptomyces sp. ISL-43]MBT2446826.1 hypothetical protein [Streptomyces sp. ISL-43]
MSNEVLRIDSLLCERSSVDTGDEVLLRVDGDRVWPGVGERTYVLKSGQEIGLLKDVLFHTYAHVVVTLYDQDDLSADDDLGSVSIPAVEAGTGQHTRDILGPDSHYKLTYRVGKIQF